MSIKQKIVDDFKEAFKSKELEKKDLLAMIRSEILNKEIEMGKRDEGLSDEEIIAVLQRAIKQRKESVQQYREGGRKELADKEQQEMDLLAEYMPKQMSDEEIKNEVENVIKKIGAVGLQDVGKVMGGVMSSLKGKVDGTRVREIAQDLLVK